MVPAWFTEKLTYTISEGGWPDCHPNMPILRLLTPQNVFRGFDFLNEEQSSSEWEISCPGRRWTSVQIFFDAASFIFAWEIRNCTNVQTKKKQKKQ